MLPYTAYDIIRTVNIEVDLTRAPLREHQHAFADAPKSSDDRNSGEGGGGFLVSRALSGLVRAMTPRRQVQSGQAA